MANKLQNWYAHAYFPVTALIAPLGQQMDEHMSHHAPIMEPAFQQNPHAQLLTFRILDALNAGNPLSSKAVPRGANCRG